jgi:hypothetical protein
MSTGSAEMVDGDSDTISSSFRSDTLYTAAYVAHDACLEATKKYISAHRINYQVRRRSNPHTMRPQALDSPYRWAPYPGCRNYGSRKLSDVPEATDSLLSNISSICQMIWSRSQRDRLHVLGTERMAVENMGCLLEWGETIVLGDIDEWNMSDEAAVRRFITAGQNLCAWLGDDEGVATIGSQKP